MASSGQVVLNEHAAQQPPTTCTVECEGERHGVQNEECEVDEPQQQCGVEADPSGTPHEQVASPLEEDAATREEALDMVDGAVEAHEQVDGHIKEGEEETDQVDTAAAAAVHLCEVCAEGAAKYKCPGCMKRTCSLECSKHHKVGDGCSGKRDKLKYVPLKDMTDATLMSDYQVLEEVKRAEDIAKRSCPPFPKAQLPPHLDNLVRQAQQRRVELVLMNPGMSKRKLNSTRFDMKSRKMMWRLEWVFEGAAAGAKVVNERVQEDAVLSEILEAHLQLQTGMAAKHFVLRSYADVGISELKVFMRKEGTPANQPGYYSIDTSRSLGSQLAGKVVIEYPVLLVALHDEVAKYPAPQQQPHASSQGGWDNSPPPYSNRQHHGQGWGPGGGRGGSFRGRGPPGMRGGFRGGGPGRGPGRFGGGRGGGRGPPPGGRGRWSHHFGGPEGSEAHGVVHGHKRPRTDETAAPAAGCKAAQDQNEIHL